MSAGPPRVGTGERIREDVTRARGGERRVRWALVPDRVRPRSGARVSLPSRPAQTRSHTSAASALSSVLSGFDRLAHREPSWRKK
jgi:hypothetical protein